MTSTYRSQGSDDADALTSVDTELQELQRRYRMMEGDRRSYSDESQQVIRKQRAAIDKLKSDNNYLSEELAEAQKRKSILTTDSKLASRIKDLQSQADTFNRKFEVETAKLGNIESEKKKLTKKIAEARKLNGGVQAVADVEKLVSKQISVLESRLNKSTVKYNQALSENADQRQKIDHLRQERNLFDTMYKKLEKDLDDAKREMAEIIEISNRSYQARDDAQQKMLQLKEKADKEAALFEVEARELSRAIEQDRKMKDFMKLKDKERDSNMKSRGDVSDFNQSKLRKRKAKGDRPRDKAAQQLEKVESYEEAFKKIQAATGITDIDEFVTTFIRVEDQNFSLFNYVNELNNEVEKIEESISDVKGEIERYRGLGMDTDSQRRRIIQDLEEKLVVSEDRATRYDARYTAAMKNVNALKNAVQSLFQRIGCSTSAITDMLGHAGVTEANMLQYLGVIEQRANDILLAAAAKAGPTVPGPAPPPSVHPQHFFIQPPSTGDDDSDASEDEERPLTRDELRTRTLRGLSRRDPMPRRAPKNKRRPKQ